MKQLLAISLVLVLLAAAYVVVAADVGGGPIKTLFSASVELATSTNTSTLNPSKYGLGGSKTLCVAVSGYGPTAASSNLVTATFDTSVDGVQWTLSTFSAAATMGGVTTKAAISNQTVNALGYVRLASVNNATLDSNTDTNSIIAVKVTKKPNL